MVRLSAPCHGQVVSVMSWSGCQRHVMVRLSAPCQRQVVSVRLSAPGCQRRIVSAGLSASGCQRQVVSVMSWSGCQLQVVSVRLSAPGCQRQVVSVSLSAPMEDVNMRVHVAGIRLTGRKKTPTYLLIYTSTVTIIRSNYYPRKKLESATSSKEDQLPQIRIATGPYLTVYIKVNKTMALLAPPVCSQRHREVVHGGETTGQHHFLGDQRFCRASGHRRGVHC